MVVYCIVQERNGHINSRRYFSSKENAIEWLDDLIMIGYKECLESGLISVYNHKSFASLTIDLDFAFDEYSITKVYLDPTYPLDNEDDQYIPFID